MHAFLLMNRNIFSTLTQSTINTKLVYIWAYSPTHTFCNCWWCHSRQKITAKCRWFSATNGSRCWRLATDSSWCLAASHQRFKPPGGLVPLTVNTKWHWHHQEASMASSLVFSCHWKLFEWDCTYKSIYSTLH